MKKGWSIIILTAVLLAGCGTQETFETLADIYAHGPMREPREVTVRLPREAAAVANSAEDAVLYLCDGFDVTVQTFSGGDLDGTVRNVTGYSREDLTVIETGAGPYMRYDIAWSCAGEGEDQICRAVILDDGVYHYAVSCMGNQSDYKKVAAKWEEIFDSFDLGRGSSE